MSRWPSDEGHVSATAGPFGRMLATVGPSYRPITLLNDTLHDTVAFSDAVGQWVMSDYHHATRETRGAGMTRSFVANDGINVAVAPWNDGAAGDWAGFIRILN